MQHPELNSSGDISAIRDTARACAAVTCGSQLDSSNISTVTPETWRLQPRQMWRASCAENGACTACTEIDMVTRLRISRNGAESTPLRCD
jgi:hypothetical protein